MPFYPNRYDEGALCEVPMENSVTVAKGDALDDSDDDGLFGLATSSSDYVPYVAMETVTTTSAGQKIKAIRTVGGVQFLADTTNNTAATDVNLTADLTDEDEVNNAASSNDVFYIEATVGAAADKKVLGFFMGPKATA